MIQTDRVTMNSVCVVLLLLCFSKGQVTSSAIPISMEAGISLAIDGDDLDWLKSKNPWLRMALKFSSGDQRAPKVECTPPDDSIATTTTPPPTTTTTSLPKTHTQHGCPMGFIGLGERCYYFSVTQETWRDALRSCMNLDADLAHPMSAEEDSLITTHLRNNHTGISKWWIGGTDQYEEGHWVWAHDRSTIGYTNWHGEEPNNEYNEHCAHYWLGYSRNWNDDECSDKYQFICQQRKLDVDVEDRPSDRGQLTVNPTKTPQKTTIRSYTKKECSPDFIQLGDQCYYFSTTNETWQDALRRCQSLDADLVHPMSGEEYSTIATYLSNNLEQVSRWWIGGTNRYNGHWIWVHDKSSMSYNNWLIGQPRKFENNGKCAQIWMERYYTWNDDDCSYQYQFICQQSQLDKVFQELSSGDGEFTEDI